MTNPSYRDLAIAVLIPCFNEALTIAKVVGEFRSAVPHARIYVYDNNSTDDTLSRARGAGAIVRTERAQGKGSVIRRMFADIEADIYIMVDGDDTYDATAAPALLEHLLSNNLDVVNGERVHQHKQAYRAGHEFGMLFRREFRDMLSGFKVLSRRFVKSFPALARGFEIETELTVHALEMRMAVGELAVAYKERPDGSESKLHTYRDGSRILVTILRFLKAERPLQLFATLGVLLAGVGVILSIPLIFTYVDTGLVPRIPTAILIVGLGLMSALSLTVGVILDTVTRGRQEMKRLLYLSIPATAATPHPAEARSANHAAVVEAAPVANL
jgi:Glycosyl transferase family 2